MRIELKGNQKHALWFLVEQTRTCIRGTVESINKGSDTKNFDYTAASLKLLKLMPFSINLKKLYDKLRPLLDEPTDIEFTKNDAMAMGWCFGVCGKVVEQHQKQGRDAARLNELAKDLASLAMALRPLNKQEWLDEIYALGSDPGITFNVD